jgi:hypothetical protein
MVQHSGEREEAAMEDFIVVNRDVASAAAAA